MDMVEGSSENIIVIIVDMVGIVGSTENKIMIGIEKRKVMMMTMLIMNKRMIWSVPSYSMMSVPNLFV